MYKRQEKGFEWIGAYDITADELLAGTDTAKTESKTAQAQDVYKRQGRGSCESRVDL